MGELISSYTTSAEPSPCGSEPETATTTAGLAAAAALAVSPVSGETGESLSPDVLAVDVAGDGGDVGAPLPTGFTAWLQAVTGGPVMPAGPTAVRRMRADADVPSGMLSVRGFGRPGRSRTWSRPTCLEAPTAR